MLFERLLERKNRVAMSKAEIEGMRGSEGSSGIFIGNW